MTKYNKNFIPQVKPKSKNLNNQSKEGLILENNSKLPPKIDEIEENKTDNNQLQLKKAFSSHPKDSRPIILVKNLVKKYENFVAVKGISFDVKRGEIFGILGPNGAGKTTTLEMIETILEKTEGNILVDGLDVDVYPEQIKSIIGVQLQSAGFYPHLNLIETLELFASIYNVKIEAIKFLEKVGLKEKANSQVESLSGGQKQRFSIATTLIADPEIIFLDEPTTGLDPQARRNLWDMILDLKKNGKTIIITTHYMDEAEKLCDRIAVMDSGKILEINTAEGFIVELLNKGFSKPQPKYSASLEDVFLDLTGKSWRD
jgi:ABC-2 type transport system ATP-binding protein